MKEKLAVQLYTLRNEMAYNLSGTLRELNVMGYNGVQLAGYYDLEPMELNAIIKRTGLKVAGIHIGFHRLANELEQVVTEAKIFDTRDLICSMTPVDLRDEAGYRYVKETLNQIARTLKPDGLRISYHNHAFELDSNIEGKSALEFLLDPTPCNEIMAEIDVYWIKKAGINPLQFIDVYSGRMPIIHLKDMTADDKMDFAAIGTGVIDFEAILQWGEGTGVEWYVVEQDECSGSALESVRLSRSNLINIINSSFVEPKSPNNKCNLGF